MERTIDVTALGELLIDFTESGLSPQGNPLLEANPGGAPCNLLAMLARLGTLLERYDLPRRLDLPETAWRQYLLRDKKRSGGEMTIAVLERPGHGVLWSVTPEELLEETRWM